MYQESKYLKEAAARILEGCQTTPPPAPQLNAAVCTEPTAMDLLGVSILELYQVRSVLWGIQERLTGKSDGLKVDGTLGEPCQPSLMMGLAELRKEVSDLNDLARSIVKIL